ncbi:hypothetical protein VPH166E361_0108 [Vibrio phage 166E36-1]
MVAKRVVVGDFRAHYEYYNQPLNPDKLIRQTAEYVAYKIEKVTLPIDAYRKYGQETLYVAYDKSFTELVAMYQSADRDAVEALRKDAIKYRDNWLKACTNNAKLIREVDDVTTARDKLSSQLTTLKGSF